MPTNKQETPKAQGKPIFVGKSALVRLVNGEDINTATIWLVDPANKTLRPFVSEEQFDKFFDNPQQALKAVVTLSSDELSAGGILDGYKVLDSSYGINPDGSMKDVSFSPSQLQDRYGQPLNEPGEQKSVQIMDQLLGSMGNSSLPPDQIPLGASEGAGVATLPGGVPVSPADIPAGPAAVPEQPIMAPQGPIGNAGRGGPASGTVINQYSRPEYQGAGGVGSGTVYNQYSRYPYNRDGKGGSLNYYNVGQSGANTSRENEALAETKGIATAASGNALTSAYVTKIKSDPELLAYYVSALTYGSYTIEDVVNDMVRRQKAEAGDASMNSFSTISPNIAKTDYIATEAGKKAETLSTSLVPPSSMMSIGSYDTLKGYTIYNMPDNFYKELVPTLDVTDPAFVSSVNDVKSAYYDIMSDIATAETDQTRSIAQNNLQTLIDQVKSDYGFTLSSNANTAWSQLNSIDTSASTRGIQGSGMENEDVDKYLATVRASNDKTRADALTKEEQDKKDYYQNNASDAEIAALSPEDRQKYGLQPDATTLNSLTVDAIKQKYPYLTDTEAQRYHDSILSANNTFRSSSYAALAKTDYTNASDKFAAQQTILEQQQLDADAKARKESGLDSNDPNSINAYNKPSSTNQEQGLGDNTPGLNLDQIGISGVSGTSGTPPIVSSQNTTQPSNNTTNTLPNSSLSPGSTGDSVKALQKYLQDQGFFPKDQTLTTYYGDITKKAVADYQKSKGLDAGADAGYWGPKTISLMNGGSIQNAVSNATTPVTQSPTWQSDLANVTSSYKAPVVTPAPAATSTASSSNALNLSNAAANISKSLNVNQPVYSTPKVATTTNPVISSSNQTTLPTAPKTAAPVQTTSPVVASTPNSSYTIKSGDTLGKIAAANGTTVAALQALNNIKDANKIASGASIKLK